MENWKSLITQEMNNRDDSWDSVVSCTLTEEGLLTILFIGLKLTGFITWSWWWVLSPIWISILFVIGLLLAFKK